MNRNRTGVRAALSLGACATIAGAALLSGCGRQAVLEQPAPLFGQHAKAEYQQRKAEEAQEAQARSAQQRSDAGSAERTGQPPPGADDAPRTTRELQDPNQQLTPASSNPIPGTQSDPFGPQPSQSPPVR